MAEARARHREARAAVRQADAELARLEELHAAGLSSEVDVERARSMDELGLVYGAIDLILTPAGEHVLLEFNPLGEWGMLEKELGLPISQTVADALLGSAM